MKKHQEVGVAVPLNNLKFNHQEDLVKMVELLQCQEVHLESAKPQVKWKAKRRKKNLRDQPSPNNRGSLKSQTEVSFQEVKWEPPRKRKKRKSLPQLLQLRVGNLSHSEGEKIKKSLDLVQVPGDQEDLNPSLQQVVMIPLREVDRPLNQLPKRMNRKRMKRVTMVGVFRAKTANQAS